MEKQEDGRFIRQKKVLELKLKGIKQEDNQMPTNEEDKKAEKKQSIEIKKVGSCYHYEDADTCKNDNETVHKEIYASNSENYKKIKEQHEANTEKLDLEDLLNDITTVAVTGASGYLGLHLVTTLLDEGFSVKAGVGPKCQIKNNISLNELCDKYPDQLTVIRFTLNNIKEAEELLKDTEAVIHCASISRASPNINSVNILYPEIEGLMNLLTTCTKNNIFRFVLVSCISNITGGKYRKNYNESHWANPDDCDIFERAKFLTEKIAWNYVEEQKNGIKLTVLCPGILVGPAFQDSLGSVNISFVRKLYAKKLNYFMNVKIPLLDVRDLAKVCALSVKNAASINQRYIVNEGVYWIRDVHVIIHNEKYKKKNKQPTYMNRVLLQFLAFFDKDLKKILEFYDKPYNINDEKFKRDFKFKYRRVDEALKTMVEVFKSQQDNN